MKSAIGIDPSSTLPISVTKSCPMNCGHCGGHYIKHMVHIDDIEKYLDRYNSFLVSGGMFPSGEIPFKPYLEKLRQLKETHDLKYNFHIGFPKNPPYELEGIADVISFDFFGDKDVLKELYGIDRTPEEILDSILPLNVKKVPHVTIGVICGKITHEPKAIDILSEYFNSIVLNIFIPTTGTKYSDCQPPLLEEVEKIFDLASKKFEKITLGCMQPKGDYRKKLQEIVSNYANFIVKPFDKNYAFDGCCAFYQ
ncbi:MULTISPECIES: radical SAM protein [Fervidobacterium]|uniref:Radical SAM domain protein n=1 Tax=Fervidobacterium nodosum (strain ATCC 35602 / DSM 5306 / Rt17-B1) TaxID=381764 RepID=A7HNQ2_FERNB|nr:MULTISPECIES: radical SAM protein [Fervidobacterium]ABS61535.1 Radical SAM domain protein [Fervidobacterium nodosum Rt17-B1]HOJ94123.1 radical SAM protein [Fervidobacterium nodosum]